MLPCENSSVNPNVSLPQPDRTSSTKHRCPLWLGQLQKQPVVPWAGRDDEGEDDEGQKSQERRPLLPPNSRRPVNFLTALL